MDCTPPLPPPAPTPAPHVDAWARPPLLGLHFHPGVDVLSIQVVLFHLAAGPHLHAVRDVAAARGQDEVVDEHGQGCPDERPHPEDLGREEARSEDVRPAGPSRPQRKPPPPPPSSRPGAPLRGSLPPAPAPGADTAVPNPDILMLVPHPAPGYWPQPGLRQRASPCLSAAQLSVPGGITPAPLEGGHGPAPASEGHRLWFGKRPVWNGSRNPQDGGPRDADSAPHSAQGP